MPSVEKTMDPKDTQEPQMPQAQPKKRHPLERKRWRFALALLVIAAIGFGVYYWTCSRGRESTDDAFIDAHVLPMSSKVPGQVLRVLVDDNQHVGQGDLLVEIDPKDYQVRLDQARADLAAAEADTRRTATDAERAQQLFARDEVSRQALDKAVAEADMARARSALARQKVAAAELDLSYTRITTPQAGKVTRKSVELRSYVQVGQPLMAIVPDQVWVAANFKETQLTRMRAGQRVDIRVDAYPGKDFEGHVDSIQSGTGSRFSLLPAENATGNYVKVVQRVPVKIVFDGPTAGYLLAPGMSVVPVVHLR
jgi:membrane fusion protein, multidrug efflux system